MKYLDGGLLTFLLWIEKSNLTLCLSATSAFVGLATMVVLFPVPGYIAKKIRDVQVQKMKMVWLYPKCLLLFLTWHSFRIQDGCPSARCYRRYNAYNHWHGLPLRCRWPCFIFAVVNVLRMIKLFGWERKVSDRIGEKRNTELNWLWKLKVGRMTILLLSTCHWYHILGVRNGEWVDNVSVADYPIILFGRYQNLAVTRSLLLLCWSPTPLTLSL